MHHSSRPEVWDSLARDYDAPRVQDPVYRACLQQTVEVLQPSGKVLDAGCGTGLATQLLLDCDEVKALDFSAASLRTLQTKLGARDNVDAVWGDLRDLPFPDATFDSVLCANALACLSPEAHSRAAAELLRVLKPHGRYAVSAHHYSRAKQRRKWIKEGRPGQPGVDYIFRFSREELVTLFPGSTLRAVGFYSLPGRLQNWIARWAGEVVDKLESGHMLIAYGRKPR
jgi:SAM-dependent methyltransferase